MAGTIREAIAELREMIATERTERREADLAIVKQIRGLVSEPKRAPRKVAEPRKAIKASKRSKRPSRRTPCNLNGCSRLFFSSIGANDHRCR